jgi:nitrate reductase gamma subunit
MSDLLHFSEHRLQEVALIFMATIYILRIRWLLKYKSGKERQGPTGAADTTPRKGIVYSWVNIGMPWAMESTRRKFLLYVQFVLFHLGVVSAIGLSFVIPYGPEFLNTPGVVPTIQILVGAACVVGVLRMFRRWSDKHMRAISTPDDHFSLALLTCWFFFAFLAAPNNTGGGEWHLIAFFVLTAFFLVYVPFSKISHYLYYPFTRYYLGKTMGYRGTYPIRRSTDPRHQRTIG